MNIFVSHLSYSMQDADLQNLFSSFGAVDSAHIIIDRQSGRSKGFGFVEMPNEEEAKAAIAGLNGTEQSGFEINVAEARPREDRPRRDDRRGGFGGGRRY